MSVTKVVVSLAAGTLVQQGLLSADDPIRRYLPELSDDWETCSVGDVWDMASGVECREIGDPGAYCDPAHPFYRFEATLGWHPTTRESPYDLVRGFRRTGPPGARYEYTSVDTFMFAWVIERVASEGFIQASERLIWSELALADTVRFCVNAEGVAVSHGGLIMTVDDLARLGTWLPDSWAVTGHQGPAPAAYLTNLRTRGGGGTSRRGHSRPGLNPPGSGSG